MFLQTCQYVYSRDEDIANFVAFKVILGSSEFNCVLSRNCVALFEISHCVSDIRDGEDL